MIGLKQIMEAFRKSGSSWTNAQPTKLCKNVAKLVEILPSNEMENSDLIKIVLSLTKVSNYDVSYIHLRITDIAVEGNIDEKLTF